ncbi:probable LRR receptor-like serine/threonine-protein kinase At1g67720 isoform X2 [Amborella trichopoda]|uniref:probable LRR receptor-like serine/threonine-protein kinase At1g67720 isoform X2 n=1 Tax=Amborella trichopoda TaxID=13333 RepID=UPI0009BEF969|nr:probable LRR receptor-like serine/threonine-protein kinase At1g67720 isoform X2 [Amborella trichopoda]|eukprot:XP_020529980.1 probable LRR receptor-like serine/threonine-protein kinase At1g67720 isoform X2 [Amborella trichopoda]
MFAFFFLLFTALIYHVFAQVPGFFSIDCGGTEKFLDEIGLEWTPDKLVCGNAANISVGSENTKPYTTLRYFPADSRKYCYTLSVEARKRYLVRASFLYGNFDRNDVYPKFDISLGATHWSTIVISDADTLEVRELIFLATSPSISVCLSNASTGQPFISTLELRQFNGSMYYTDFETASYLSVSARINFGAVNNDSVRIWESDSIRKANFLVDVAAGTSKISTTTPINVNRDERPPEKVMQTAVVGRNGLLNYRLNLDGFPGFGWAFSYFSEIEDLGANESRKFRLKLPGYPDITKATVNIQENAQGRYRLYEPGFTNLSLPFVLTFSFGKTADSSRGPLLNAMEINKYLQINFGSPDAAVISGLTSQYPQADWAQEGGDPCLPVPWSWLQCSMDAQPRIFAILLSRKNLPGNIPSKISKLTGLVELWLDGNSLSGSIPDLSDCTNLRIIHLENNRLTGALPSFLTGLPNLAELYVQNNLLSGRVPRGLLDKKVVINYAGNINLRPEGKGPNHTNIIVISILGGSLLLIIVIITCCFFFVRRKKHQDNEKDDASGLQPPRKTTSSQSEGPAETAHFFTYEEIEDATGKFQKRIGSGGFGTVYYGRLNDGKEIAVKVLSSNSYQGKKEFSNEVSLLSRIHHRNLVAFLGYCQEEGKSILVYEYMHNGTLKEHLYGPLTQERAIDWIKRLEIAEDAAKAIEYLHTGCIPSIIHRDLKSSNILLDKHMRAKVSDFGLSKLAVDASSHVSSMVRGTVGYLDPEYYISQQLTEKSDVYSFGVILLELISGQEAISNESFGVHCRNIVQWARFRIDNGDIQSIIDTSLQGNLNVQSVWKIAEKAMQCVQPHGRDRPPISEVLKEIQDAISIERGSESEDSSEGVSRDSRHSSLNLATNDPGVSDTFVSSFDDDPIVLPTAR